MLEEKPEEDKEKELANIKMKQAETVVINSKAKASQKVPTGQVFTAAKMAVITQQHHNAINRVQR